MLVSLTTCAGFGPSFPVCTGTGTEIVAHVGSFAIDYRAMLEFISGCSRVVTAISALAWGPSGRDVRSGSCVSFLSCLLGWWSWLCAGSLLVAPRRSSPAALAAPPAVFRFLRFEGISEASFSPIEGQFDREPCYVAPDRVVDGVAEDCQRILARGYCAAFARAV